MGVNLSHPSVYEEPLKIRYRANSIGARVCELLGLLVVLIVPFIVCLAMNDFWTQYNVVADNPSLAFTERCLLKYSTVLGQERLWACSDALNEELQGDARHVVPHVAFVADDRDADNKTDEFTFTFQLPLSDDASDGLASFEFLPELNCRIWNYAVHLQLLTAPFVSLEDPRMGKSRVIIAQGELQYHETELVIANDYVRYDRVYASSLFDDIHDIAAASNVGSLAAAYAQQNQSIVYAPKVVVFGDMSLMPSPGPRSVVDLDAADMVTVILKLRVVEAHVAYRPGYGEIIKWAWTQYFAVAYVVHWLVTWARWFFVKQALINTIAVWEGKGTH